MRLFLFVLMFLAMPAMAAKTAGELTLIVRCDALGTPGAVVANMMVGTSDDPELFKTARKPDFTFGTGQINSLNGICVAMKAAVKTDQGIP